MQSALNAPQLCNEDAAIAHIEAWLWPDGPVCPHCGTIGEATLLKGKSTRPGLWKCRACRKPFTVRMGTLFESSHVPLHIWLQAIYLLCSSKKGISTRQLHRTLGGSLKTAWFLMHRIREAMREGKLPGGLGGEGKFVEADETYVGGKAKNRAYAEKLPRHEPVVALVERKGRVASFHVPNVNATNMKPIIKEQISDKSHLRTDESAVYLEPGKSFASHEVVNHSAKEYVRGDAYTNTVEGYFSILKRGIYGVYHHVSQEHLKRYLAEFDFRYNYRIALGFDDATRADLALLGVKGKRLTYETTRHRGALEAPPS
jgi:transposase-like protein